MSAYYHDDPVEFPEPKSKKFPALFALLLFLFAGGNFIQTTLAANISLNSGGRVEFGQASSIATACSEGSTLAVTPKSEFINSAGAGAYYVKSVTVSGIPSSCNGKDFNISFFDNTNNSTALPIFETSTSIATVWNNGGAFVEGYLGTGTTITSGSGTFTVSFNSPVALSGDAQKITLQSTEHKSWTCADGKRPCALGDPGPGGGFVTFVSAGFNCGPTATATCKYLEIAPSGWNGSDNEKAAWSSSAQRYTQIVGTGGMVSDNNTYSVSSIGRGYLNTLAIIAKDNSTSIAAYRARAYQGGGLSDWYLPNVAEANQLCQWTNAQNLNPGQYCNSYWPTANNARWGAQLGGLVIGDGENAYYWTSSEGSYLAGRAVSISEGVGQNFDKPRSYLVRPVRAFN